MDDLDDLDEYTTWCKSFFASLADGGMWGVPRSGLVFQRRGSELVLFEQMPFQSEMEDLSLDVPHTPEELLSYQEADFEIIKRHFEKAGVVVRRKEEEGTPTPSLLGYPSGTLGTPTLDSRT